MPGTSPLLMAASQLSSWISISAAKAWKQAEDEGRTRPNGGDARALSENPKLIREPGKHLWKIDN